MIYKIYTNFLLFAVCFCAAAGAAFAAEGDLDLSFDGDGIVVTDNGLSDEFVRDLAIQPNGKIVAVSYQFSATVEQAVIVRYNVDGSIDSTFGSSGKVLINTVVPTELALQSNGKIVLVGTIGTTSSANFYVARLNADGSFDATFNGSGAVTQDLRGTADAASAVEIQTDGKIVVGGSSRQTAASRSDFAIVRFNIDGSLDATFDDDGKIFTALQENSAGVNDLTIQTDGKIVAAGEVFTVEVSSGNPIGSFAVVRYNPNGAVDAAFNGGGSAVTQFAISGSLPGNSRNNTPEAVIVRPNGKILVVGLTKSCCSPQPFSQVAMIQYNADGSTDSSFGTAGKTQSGFTTFPMTSAFDAAIQSNDKIIVAGISQANIQANFTPIVGRFNQNGSLDTTFSGDGWSALTLTGVSGYFSAAAIQPNGKIVAGGYVGNSTRDSLLARFEASGCRTANCAGERQKTADFDGDGRTDLSVFRSGTWYINASSANNSGSFYAVQLGLTTDKLTPADFDGDGKTDIAVWRENAGDSLGYFYILQSATNALRVVQFGRTGDDPRVVGDWDGDGLADLAVYRNGATVGSQSFFYYRPSSQTTNGFAAIIWGTAGDEAVRGDFDGDGRMDAAIFRASDGIWYILNSSNQQARYERWGLAADKRLTGDFDADGKTDLAIFRDGLWAVLQSQNNQPRYERWGLSGDRIVAGDYDGDGRTDFAVRRAGVYYILQNSNSQPVYSNFGLADDVPVASAFVR